MQWDDSVNSSPTTTVTISFCKSFYLTFGQECSQNALSSISMNVNFSFGGREGALSPQFLRPLLSEFSGSAPEIRLSRCFAGRSSLSSWFAWWGSYCLIVCKDC